MTFSNADSKTITTFSFDKFKSVLDTLYLSSQCPPKTSSHEEEVLWDTVKFWASFYTTPNLNPKDVPLNLIWLDWGSLFTALCSTLFARMKKSGSSPFLVCILSLIYCNYLFLDQKYTVLLKANFPENRHLAYQLST